MGIVLRALEAFYPRLRIGLTPRYLVNLYGTLPIFLPVVMASQERQTNNSGVVYES